MSQADSKIAALRSAMDAADASLGDILRILALLEDAYPTPGPVPVEELKQRFGAVAQNWTDARNYAVEELRKL